MVNSVSSSDSISSCTGFMRNGVSKKNQHYQQVPESSRQQPPSSGRPISAGNYQRYLAPTRTVKSDRPQRIIERGGCQGNLQIERIPILMQTAFPEGGGQSLHSSQPPKLRNVTSLPPVRNKPALPTNEAATPNSHWNQERAYCDAKFDYAPYPKDLPQRQQIHRRYMEEQNRRIEKELYQVIRKCPAALPKSHNSKLYSVEQFRNPSSKLKTTAAGKEEHKKTVNFLDNSAPEPRQYSELKEDSVDADHLIHLACSEDKRKNWKASFQSTANRSFFCEDEIIPIDEDEKITTWKEELTRNSVPGCEDFGLQRTAHKDDDELLDGLSQDWESSCHLVRVPGSMSVHVSVKNSFSDTENYSSEGGENSNKGKRVEFESASILDDNKERRNCMEAFESFQILVEQSKQKIETQEFIKIPPVKYDVSVSDCERKKKLQDDVKNYASSFHQSNEKPPMSTPKKRPILMLKNDTFLNEDWDLSRIALETFNLEDSDAGSSREQEVPSIPLSYSFTNEKNPQNFFIQKEKETFLGSKKPNMSTKPIEKLSAIAIFDAVMSNLLELPDKDETSFLGFDNESSELDFLSFVKEKQLMQGLDLSKATAEKKILDRLEEIFNNDKACGGLHEFLDCPNEIQDEDIDGIKREFIEPIREVGPSIEVVGYVGCTHPKNDSEKQCKFDDTKEGTDKTKCSRTEVKK